MGDEEAEEEAWYNQMELSARNQFIDSFDELGEWQTRLQQLQLSAERVSDATTDQDEDDRYFSDLVHHSKYHAHSIIASEDDSIWHHVIRDMVQSAANVNKGMDYIDAALLEVKIEDSSTLLYLQNWLFGFLPVSSKVYSLLRNIINDCCQYKHHIMTDHFSDPSVLLIFHYSKVDAVELSIFSPSFMDEQLFSTICNTLQCGRNGISDICLSAIDSSLFEKYVVDRKCWAVLWTEQCGMFVHSEVATSACEELPCGYELCALKEEDALLVDSNWLYRSESSFNKIKHMISKYPCYGVRQSFEGTTGPLVSWCLTYEYGAVGMLFTLESHRRKGFSRAVVQRVVQASCSRSPAFAYIEASNSASQTLFRSLGFVRCCDAVWVGVHVL